MRETEIIYPARTLQDTTQDWYTDYYAKKGANRNSLLHNPEVLFQSFAQEAAMVRALQSVRPDPQTARVLDVGCGEGNSLLLFLKLGFEPSHLFGVDLLEDRIRRGRTKLPLVNFTYADATCLALDAETFDIVVESTMFVHATDDGLAMRIASEMTRVTKPGGVLILSDWRYSKPVSLAHRAVSTRRISDLFQVGTRTEVFKRFRGPLVPPLGRFLSQYLPSSYFMIHALCPVLVGQMTTVLRKLRS